jgi:hypothetical protein
MNPADFPVGSLASRAAARIRLSVRSSGRKRITILCNIPRPGISSLHWNFGNWQKYNDGKLMRLVCVPHVSVKPGEPTPTCPDCGTPFRKTAAEPNTNMVYFEANCMGQHDPELIANREKATLPK